MPEASNVDNTNLFPHRYCAACRWAVVELCCNGPLAETEPYKGWDWWLYCSNPLCKNHVGEGWFQELPEWLVPDIGRPDSLHSTLDAKKRKQARTPTKRYAVQWQSADHAWHYLPDYEKLHSMDEAQRVIPELEKKFAVPYRVHEYFVAE